MTLFNEGPRTAVIINGNISGGKAMNPSVIRIMISSVRFFEIPENIPTGKPIIIDKKTTPKATLSEDSPA
jgi:hypothetical protein